MPDNIFSSVLQQFGERINVGGLELDEFSSCMLSIDDMVIALQFKEEAETLLVYAPVGSISASEDNVSLYEELLAANLLGGETKGLSLGLSKELEAIFLSGTLPTRNLDAVVLERFVQFFTDQAEEWHKRLASRDAGEKQPLPDPVGWPGGGIRA